MSPHRTRLCPSIRTAINRRAHQLARASYLQIQNELASAVYDLLDEGNTLEEVAEVIREWLPLDIRSAN